MKTILSRSNSVVKQIEQLHTTKGRATYKQFLAQNIRVCQTLLQSSIPLVQIYCTQEKLGQAKKLVDSSLITVVSEPVMEKISTLKSQSGILGVFSIPDSKPLSDLAPGIVLADIQDPGNMGTLIRTAAALAIKNIVIINGVDVWNPKVIQACAGTIGYIDIIQTSWQELISEKKDLKLCALVVKKGKRPREIPADDPLLVIGSEAYGIRNEWYSDMDYFLTIPMPGSTESLNAAIAGALAMYAIFYPEY